MLRGRLTTYLNIKDKGVFCQIAEECDMPIDADGNRAEIVMDPNSTISRMNLGRLYEQYLSASSRDTHKLICRTLGISPFTNAEHCETYLQGLDNTTIQKAWELLIGIYKIVSPKMREWVDSGVLDCTQIEYLAKIVEKGIYLYIPTDNAPEATDMITELENSPYRPLYGPVSYVGNSGRRVVTKSDVRIGSMYVILLEKIGDDWSAVSSGKLQHFGVLSQLTKQDKFSKPARLQAVRGAGEAEVRIYTSYIGPEFVAEMMDRNNNPTTHKAMVKNILTADKPTNIYNLIDRDKHPYGGCKPLVLAEHFGKVGGFTFEYKPYKPTWETEK